MFYKIIKYNKNFQKKIDINLEDSLKNYLYNIKKKEVIFLIRYKRFKINNFPLPSCFESMNSENKIIILEINKYNYKYSLNNKFVIEMKNCMIFSKQNIQIIIIRRRKI